MMKIGFIGLGKMGLPMALNLCKAGFTVYVCSGSKTSEEQIINAGGFHIDSFQLMAEKCDTVITVLPADKEIIDIYTGTDGILEHAHDNLLCIDMTSAKGLTKSYIAQQISNRNLNIDFVDAPVSGGVAGAVNGTLTIMTGCKATVFENCKNILEAMGKNIIYTGDIGSGSNVKMLNQMLNAANTAIAAEVLCISRELGIDDETLSKVINISSGASFVFEKNVPKYMMTGDHTPGFRLDLMKKDVSLFNATATDLNAFTPIADLVYQIYKAASNQGNGDKNYTGVHTWYESNQ